MTRENGNHIGQFNLAEAGTQAKIKSALEKKLEPCYGASPDYDRQSEAKHIVRNSPLQTSNSRN